MIATVKRYLKKNISMEHLILLSSIVYVFVGGRKIGNM